MHITLSEENYQWLKENVENASDFIDKLIEAAKHGFEQYLANTPKTNTGREGFEPPTAGLRVQEFEKEGICEEIRAEEFDLKKFYKKYKKEFKEWLVKRVEESTAEKYLSALDRYLVERIKEPKDLDEIVTRSKYVGNGLRNFLNFLEHQYYMDELGGYPFSAWKKHMPTKTGKTKEEGKIFLTDEDIKEAYRLIQEKWNDEATTTLFKLMVFSGIRLEHAYKILQTFDPKKLVIEGDIAYYPFEELTKGKKKGYCAFMPAKFAKKLKRFDNLLGYGSYKNRLNPRRWKPKEDNPTTPVRIRSWFQNFAIDNDLKPEVVRFIVGHSPATVGEKHYYDKLKHARKGYRELVHKFPIPP